MVITCGRMLCKSQHNCKAFITESLHKKQWTQQDGHSNNRKWKIQDSAKISSTRPHHHNENLFLDHMFMMWWRIPFLSPSGDLGIGLVWGNFSIPTDFSVRLLKSSSNWIKLSMMGPQLLSGWYKMISYVFRCSQLGCNVFAQPTHLRTFCEALFI